ncbi:MAG: thiamine-phosphate kinase [Rikenellaceae bacterium]|nr:thiamine-phosphate kinase [Rikenellaceae bacterium]
MDGKKRTEIAELGKFGLIDRLTAGFAPARATTIKGAGDDAAVIDTGDRYTLVSTDLLLEGVDFDLVYTPLRHLGYKAVVAGCSDIYAMNGTPQQVMLALGVSARFSVEDLEELYAGVKLACKAYGVDLAGGDTSASVNGLTIGITTVGSVARDKIVYRSGAKKNDLVCITGDLGAAYMGLHLLEREKRAYAGSQSPQPKFEGREYILGRQLKPESPREAIEALGRAGIVPTAMIDLTDGLASDLLHICKQSACGARIYLDRIPIARQTSEMAEELHIDPVTAALNGGGDYELLFTVPLDRQEELFKLGAGIEVIGHITDESTGVALTTPDGEDIALTAPGWKTREK